MIPATNLQEGIVIKSPEGQRFAVQNVDGLDTTVKYVENGGTVFEGEIPTQKVLSDFQTVHN